MRVKVFALVASLALGIISAAPAADAQPPTKIPRIGLLGSESPPAQYLEAFRLGLSELGYVEGRNIVIEYRWGQGRSDQLADLAAELVRLKVDLIVAVYTPAARAAKQATVTIPIVMASSGDPVAMGLVASLARPGGNITGLSALAPELMGERLELLKEAVPKVSRVAVLLAPENPTHPIYWRALQVAAPRLRVQLQSMEVPGPSEFEATFSKMTKERAGAVLVLLDALFLTHQRRIVELAARTRVPALYPVREFVEGGGLMAYGPNQPDLLRRAAAYVDKILKGAKPSELPIEQPTKFELIINLKTAKALGLTIPQSILVRADEVIK
jgi:putative ABC transport system substrate-binding protein